MALSLIHLIILTALFCTAAVSSAFLARLIGIPDGGILAAIAISSGLVVILGFAWPVFRRLQLRPIGLPDCPRCKRVPPVYRISGTWPHFIMTCTVCEQPLEAWMCRKLPTGHTPSTIPTFYLRWPEFWGSWRCLPLDSADETRNDHT